MWGVQAPALINALLVRFSTWPGLGGATPPVQVRDGPQVADESAMEILMVGWSGVEDEMDADSTMAQLGLSDPSRETTTIRCGIAVISGGTDVSVPRARAYALLAEAGAAITSDRTLGGVALRALIASASLVQSQTDRGAQAVVTFTVDCDTFTAR